MDSESVGGSWLQPETDEYDQIYHALRLSIVDGRIPIDLEIWSIDNPAVKGQYRRRCESLLKLSSWVNPDGLSEDNSIRNLCVRGNFTFPQGGMEFSTGIVTTLPSSQKSSGNKQTLILAEIAVGKSVVKDDIKKCSVTLPSGYDSYYITEQLLDRNQDGEFSLTEYQDAATFNHRDPRYVSE